MEPLFKVGDKVVVVNRVYNDSDYKFNFTDDMLTLAKPSTNKTLKIKEKIRNAMYSSLKKTRNKNIK